MPQPFEHNAAGERPSWKRSVVTVVVLSVLFSVVYSSTNWITSQRSDVGTWYYAWERYIPFITWMIIPYMSIDLFFVVAPFLCANVDEQRLFSRRVVFTVIVAGICFLLFPLQLAVERPHVEGWLGAIFNTFREYDLPYNLCPSMHIALRTLLADLYAFHTRGLSWIASHIWFSLIGLSTLFTYQHHVVDVVGGFILATCCFYLIRSTPLVQASTGNRRVGLYYAAATVVLITTAVTLQSWGLLLLWPATATGLVTCGYFFLGAGVFPKTDGRLPLSTRVILAPVLFGQYLSLIYYRRQCRPWDQVTERVWIGRVLSNQEASAAVNDGVSAIVDLTVNFSEAKPLQDVEYLQLPVLDLTAPTAAQIDQAVAFIESQESSGVVYVHCKIGYSRSAAIVGAYLIASGAAANADEAIRRLREVRPTIVIRPEAEQAIRDYASRAR